MNEQNFIDKLINGEFTKHEANHGKIWTKDV